MFTVLRKRLQFSPPLQLGKHALVYIHVHDADSGRSKNSLMRDYVTVLLAPCFQLPSSPRGHPYTLTLTLIHTHTHAHTLACTHTHTQVGIRNHHLLRLRLY